MRQLWPWIAGWPSSRPGTIVSRLSGRSRLFEGRRRRFRLLSQRDFHVLTVTVAVHHGYGHLISHLMGGDALLHLIRGADGLSVDREKDVARLEPGSGRGGQRQHLGDNHPYPRRQVQHGRLPWSDRRVHNAQE